MLQPTGLEYREQQKGRNTGIATRSSKVNSDGFGLKAVDRGRLTARQIEAARHTVTRYAKRGGRIWVRVFPDKPVAEKPIQAHMGGGKGNVEYYITEVKPGRVLCEIDGVPEALVRETFELTATKLPIPTTFAVRQVGQ